MEEKEIKNKPIENFKDESEYDEVKEKKTRKERKTLMGREIIYFRQFRQERQGQNDKMALNSWPRLTRTGIEFDKVRLKGSGTLTQKVTMSKGFGRTGLSVTLGVGGWIILVTKYWPNIAIKEYDYGRCLGENGCEILSPFNEDFHLTSICCSFAIFLMIYLIFFYFCFLSSFLPNFSKSGILSWNWR